MGVDLIWSSYYFGSAQLQPQSHLEPFNCYCIQIIEKKGFKRKINGNSKDTPFYKIAANCKSSFMPKCKQIKYWKFEIMFGFICNKEDRKSIVIFQPENSKTNTNQFKHTLQKYIFLFHFQVNFLITSCTLSNTQFIEGKDPILEQPLSLDTCYLIVI